jgi:hypothetical protein
MQLKNTVFNEAWKPLKSVATTTIQTSIDAFAAIEASF